MKEKGTKGQRRRIIVSDQGREQNRNKMTASERLKTVLIDIDGFFKSQYRNPSESSSCVKNHSWNPNTVRETEQEQKEKIKIK